MKTIPSIALMCILLLTSCTTMKDRWYDARRFNTIESYEAFIERYPESPFVSDARAKILTIKNRNLIKSSVNGKSSQVMEWINRGADINIADKFGSTPLHFAVAHKDESLVSFLISKGANVNKPGELGDTPLHISNYLHEEKISRALQNAGAIQSQLNKYGLSPKEMAVLPEMEKLVSMGANLLNNSGNWTDKSKGRKVYDELKKGNTNHVVNSIVLKVIHERDIRLRVLILAVKLGIQGSEEKLNSVLMDYGNVSMAEDFLNSGSSTLAGGGRSWAGAHGYKIVTGAGSHRAGWGRF